MRLLKIQHHQRSFFLYISIATIIILFSCQHSECFVIAIMKHQTKCFYSNLDDSYMIQVRVGLPRKTRHNCLVRYTIQHANISKAKNQTQIYTSLQNNTIQCHTHSSNTPIVHKFSPTIPSPATVSTKYRVCLTTINDFGTNKTLIQLKLSKKQKQSAQYPTNYASQHKVYQFQMLAQSIRRQIAAIKISMEQCLLKMDELKMIQQKEQQIGKRVFWGQIFGLIFYGVIWVAIVWKLYSKISKY